jgi:unsaturated chondroitin disaccharide hydrolase
MRRTTLLLALFITVVYVNAQTEKSIKQLTKEVMERATTQYTNMASTLDKGKMPRSFSKNKLITSDIYWWCSGFYPGTLWYLYEYTGSENIKKLAQTYTEELAPLQFLKTDHDIGFQLFCSYGNGYRLTGNKEYMDILHNGALSLATRFNPIIGSIRSWDQHRDKWKFPVIIDNMMNLELIMWVANQYNDPCLKTVAITHANTTIRNHFRPDYSTYHLVDYNPENGEIVKKQTVQGYSDNSRWARGQAWALYGFTMMYRMTHSSRYLEQAQSIADMLLPLLPPDGIPYWDFDAPDIPNDLRDASAGAIMASAFIELSEYIPERKTHYRSMAEQQLRTLSSPEYLAEPNTNGNFILKHSVGHKPMKGEVDVPLTYADYYFIEAFMRINNLEE